MKNGTLIAIRSFIVSAGATAASSFIGVFGVFIGATAVEMGWLQSTANAISNGGQILWGRLSDRFGRRKPFLISGSVVLAVLWYMLSYIRTPLGLIMVYAAISLFGSLITVNWFSLIADQINSTVRGRFLSIVNVLSSIGTIASLIAMVFLFRGSVTRDIFIPFSAAAGSYIISAVLMAFLNESSAARKFSGNLMITLKNLRRENRLFYRYFMAMNVQGLFWSMAWPMFPMTIVLVMKFDLSQVALLTIASLFTSVVVQYLLGRITDRVSRPPLIFGNRVMLSAIPLFYAFFSNFREFVAMEIYSGILGSIQNVVMNSYLLDIVPDGHRAEYISIMNGFNGLVYLIGALSGGYILAFMEALFPIRTALIYSYMIVFAGRFISAFLFIGLREPDQKGRAPLGLYSFLLRSKQPGSPSGGTMRAR
ncbi:MFS transporter [Thermoplasma sp. Kam2015]|uniref:MFS transporter n=1 Tax=Thermoplasma sp. Kam2015 TaxID=2094122 RepID=UPI000D8DFAC1|nr:MFS transporter [Thermoplasma sp. Kam2015]PYB67488.1 MFS transporter [Thermoplasma sp. Kam2015]